MRLITLWFANFVDFDSSFVIDVTLKVTEKRWNISIIACRNLANVKDGDLVLVTADHGNDPTWEGSDHTREKIPVLFFGSDVQNKELAPMKTFADIGQTIASFMNIEPTETGTKAYLFC